MMRDRRMDRRGEPTQQRRRRSEAEKRGRASGAPKPSISVGLQKLIRGFKMGLSQLFMVYEEGGGGGGGGDEEEEEREMVIGFPTDVQHVAHIGLDGVSSMKSSSSSSRPPHEFLFLPPPHNSLSLPSPTPWSPRVCWP
uniref:CRIB domain-containing protein n=1 Tax=Ananas comosus var. bracteatus TaxID=296719 RepID=A0A6V7QTN1_ANACO